MKKSVHRNQARPAIYRGHCALTFEPLEQRTLYSADFAGVMAIQPLAIDATGPQTQEIRVIPESNQASQAQPRSTELILVDARVANVEQITQTAGATLIVVEGDTNVLAVLQTFQAQHQVELTALHIIAHGANSQLLLGNQRIDAESIKQNSTQWETVGQALSANADILLYACDFAQSDLGKETVKLLASLTKTDIAASTDTSGALQIGGDWDLEFSTGSIQTSTLFSGSDNGAYLGLLGSASSVVSTPTISDTDAISYSSRGSTFAKLDDRRSVFVWENTDGFGNKGVYGRIQTDGVLGAIFQISDTSYDHSEPSVAAGTDGRFVVAWRESNGASDDRILIRRYDTSANAIGNSSDVTPSTTKTTRDEISVSIAPNNRIGIVYVSDNHPNSGNQSTGNLGIVFLDWDTSAVFDTQFPKSSQGDYSSAAIMSTSDNGFVVAALESENKFQVWSYKPSSIYSYSSDTSKSSTVPSYTIDRLTIANDSSGKSALAYRAYDSQGDDVIWAYEFDNEYLEGNDLYHSPLRPSLPGARSLADPQLTSDGKGTFYLSAISSTGSSNGVGVSIEGTAVYAKVEDTDKLTGTPFPSAPGFTFGAARTPEMLVDGDVKTFVFGANRTNASNITEGSVQLVRTVDTDPELLVTSTTGTTSEDGSAYTFGVKLSRPPVGTVTVTVTSSNTYEGNFGAGPTTLTFTSTNWNLKQDITVYGGGSDAIIDSNQRYTVRVTASDTSTDPLLSFNGKTAAVAMINTNTDTRNSVTVTTKDDSLHIAPTGNVSDLLAHLRSYPNQVSLRDVITAFNNSPNGSGGSDQVLFSSALQDKDIQLRSALPAITDAVEIIGLAGKTSGQGLTLTQDSNLSSAQADFTLLNFASGSAGSTLSHLAIGGSKATNAEVIRIAADNVGLFHTSVGETSSQQTLANNTTAVLIQSTAGSKVLGTEIRNSSLTNSKVGVSVVQGSSVTFSSNVISRNTDHGIALNSSSAITIANSTLSGNGESGIRADNSSNVSIKDNRIGTSSDGLSALGNAGNGVYSSNSTVLSIVSNTISGNTLNGIVVSGGSGAEIKANYLGLDATGTNAIQNMLNGLLLEAAALDVSVESNFISGNGEWGIGSTGSSNVKILYNTIGLNSNGAATGNGLTNEKDGIHLRDNTTTAQIKYNVIADNGGAGIRMVGSGVTNIAVQSNDIGQDSSHNIQMNRAEGIALQSGVSDILIGGATSNEGNHIAAPVAIRIFDGATINPVSRVVYLNNAASNAAGIPISVHTGLWTTPQLEAAIVNDANDLDSGHNGLINTPSLMALRSTGQNQYEISSQYSGLSQITFRIDYYLASNGVSGAISTLEPLGSRNVTTDSTGKVSWSYSVSLPSALGTNQTFLATATKLVSGVAVETSILSDRPALIGNQAPSIPAQDQTAAENSVWTYTPIANDLESDPIRWSLGSGGQTALFSLTTGTSGQPILQFNAPGLTLGQVPDFESGSAPPGNRYLVNLVATDSEGAQSTRAIQVTVTNVAEPPTIASATAVHAFEENKTGIVSDLATSISVLSDSSATGSFSYTIVSDASTDGHLFSIAPGTANLTLNSSLDFEAPTDKDRDGYYAVRIKVTDSNGLSATQDLRILVTDVREVANNFALPTPNTVPENSTQTWALVGTDPDTTSTLRWSLSGADASKFSINSSTGLLKLLAPLDYETMGADKQLSIQITLSDSTDPATPAFERTQTILVRISDVPEGPTMSSPSLVNLDENKPLKFTLLASDQDSTNLTYELDSTTDAAFFALNATTGELTLSASHQANGLNYESNHGQDYALRVRSSDGTNNSAWQSLTVRVNDVNEAPTITSPSLIEINEDTRVAFTGTQAISFADQDSGQQYTVNLSVDTGGVMFNSQQGTQLTLSGNKTEINAALATLRFEPTSNMNGIATLKVTIQERQANGLSEPADIKITVKPVDDPPTLVNNRLITVNKPGSAISPEFLKASDVDVAAGKIEYVLGTIDSKITIKLSDTALKAGDRFTQADIDAGLVTITPKVGTSGTASIALSVYEKGASSKAIDLKFHVRFDLKSATTTTSSFASASTTPAAPSTALASSSDTKSGKTEQATNDAAAGTSDSEATELAARLARSSAAGMEPQVGFTPSTGGVLSGAQGMSVAIRADNATKSNLMSNTLMLVQTAKDFEERPLAAMLESHSQSLAVNPLGISTLSTEGRSVAAGLFKDKVFVESMNQLRDQVSEQASLEQVVVGSSVAVSTGISLGYVIWLLRGGALITSLFASLPAWRTLDPFPVLAGVDDRADNEDDSLQGMLKKAAEKFKTQKPPAEEVSA